MVHGPQLIGVNLPFAVGRGGIFDGLAGVVAFATVFTTAVAFAIALPTAVVGFSISFGGAALLSDFGSPSVVLLLSLIHI